MIKKLTKSFGVTISTYSNNMSRCSGRLNGFVERIDSIDSIRRNINYLKVSENTKK